MCHIDLPPNHKYIYIYRRHIPFFFGSSPPSECENITSLFSQSGFGFSRFHVFTFFTLCEFHMFHACSLQIQAVLRVFTRRCLLFTLSYVFTKSFCIFTVPLDFHGQTAFWRPYGPFGLRLPFLRSMSHLGLNAFSHELEQHFQHVHVLLAGFPPSVGVTLLLGN